MLCPGPATAPHPSPAPAQLGGGALERMSAPYKPLSTALLRGGSIPGALGAGTAVAPSTGGLRCKLLTRLEGAAGFLLKENVIPG